MTRRAIQRTHNPEFGEFFTAWRKGQRLTLKAVSKLIRQAGIYPNSKSWVSEIEDGEVPDPYTLAELARILPGADLIEWFAKASYKLPDTPTINFPDAPVDYVAQLEAEQAAAPQVGYVLSSGIVRAEEAQIGGLALASLLVKGDIPGTEYVKGSILHTTPGEPKGPAGPCISKVIVKAKKGTLRLAWWFGKDEEGNHLISLIGAALPGQATQTVTSSEIVAEIVGWKKPPTQPPQGDKP